MKKYHSWFSLLAIVSLIGGAPLSASAVTNYWGDISTNWNTGANWSTGITNTSLDVATFTNNTVYGFQPRFTNTAGTVALGALWQSGSAAVTLTGSGGSLNLAGVSMNGTNYGIRMDSGAGALTIGPNFGRVHLVNDQIWSNGSSSLLTVTNVASNGKRLTIAGSGNVLMPTMIAGTGTLAMNGTGYLTLLSNAGFTSGLIVNSGTVVLNNGNGFNAGGAYIGGAGAAATMILSNLNSYFSYNPPNTKVIVDNQGLLFINRSSVTMVASGQSLIITNGGRFETVSNHTFYVFSNAGGNNGLGVVGGGAGQAVVNFNGGSLNIGMTSNGGNITSNNWLLIDGRGLGAVVTNIGFFAVAGNHQSDQRSFNNSVIITNGGQLFTGYGFGNSILSNSYIGYNSNNARVTNWNNSVTIVGNNGTLSSTWNNNGRTVFVGYSATATGVSTGNFLRVATGGVLTNTRLVVGSALGLNTDNRVVLDGGKIFVTSLIATNGGGTKFIFNSGTLDVATNIAYSNNVAFVVGDGTSSATMILPNSGTHRFDGGLTLASNGTVSVAGTVIGAVNVQGGGTLAVGNGAGILTVSDLTLAAGSTLAVEIGGNIIGDFDQLFVTGNATLNGSFLDVSLINGFTPNIGDAYTIMDISGNTGGTFAGLAEGASFIADGQNFQISYLGGDGNDVLLTVIAIPEPGAFVLVGASLGLLLILRRRRY